MIRYLLDTNAIIALLNNSDARIYEKLRQHQSGAVATSSLVIHELFYGAYKSRRIQHNLEIIAQLRFPVLEFNAEDARESGDIRAALALKGARIGPLDVLIAGQAKARDLKLVTHNIKEFKRVSGLQVEDWS